jgi:adenylate cyclase class IV
MIEREVRYYPIDHDRLFKKLYGIASYRDKLLMNRWVYDIDRYQRKFMRVRSEESLLENRKGTRSLSMTMKHVRSPGAVEGTWEKEVRIFHEYKDNLIDLLEMMGHTSTSHQVNMREIFETNDYTFFIDTWPFLTGCILEIECHRHDLDQIEMDIKKLELLLQLPERFPGDIVDIYCHEFGIDRDEFHAIKELNFHNKEYRWIGKNLSR